MSNVRVGTEYSVRASRFCREARIFWLCWLGLDSQAELLRSVTEHHPAMEGCGLWSEELLCARERACMVRARCLCCGQGFVQPKRSHVDLTACELPPPAESGMAGV